MSLLLDTHALIWWFQDSDQLGQRARTAIAAQDQAVFVSAVSVFEMTTKHRRGKLPGLTELLRDISGYLADQRFETLPVSLRHAELAGNMPIPHRDPFDRLLIAQAEVERAWLVSNETLFDRFGVRRLW